MRSGPWCGAQAAHTGNGHPIHAKRRPAGALTAPKPVRIGPSATVNANALNAGIVGVMSQGASDHYMRMVADVTWGFDDRPNLRIVGMIARIDRASQEFIAHRDVAADS
jgi:hypothetical protein